MRIAGAPISWGVCEVPGWGHQIEPRRVLAEMSRLGLAATEFGPDGWLPDDTAERARLLAHENLQPVGAFVPESEVADLLRETERAHDGVSIGSYPFFREGRVGANFVVRSEDQELAQACADLLAASLESAGYPAVPGGI